MTDPIRLESFFESGQQLQGCGASLTLAREKAGISLQQAALELRMPARVLQALEAENWQQLGAPVYIRGQLRSYAKLLKVDVEPYLQQAELQAVKPADLVSHSHTPQYRRVLESVARRAVYVVITAAIAVPVWVATQSRDNGSAPTTASLDQIPPSPGLAGQTAAVGDASSAARQPAPYVASLSPLPARAAAPALSLRMSGDSWVQIHAPDGSIVEKGLIKAGEQRTFNAGQVGRIVLGNAAAVEVQQSGSNVDMTPYARANVARFTVSSDGSLVPVAN